MFRIFIALSRVWTRKPWVVWLSRKTITLPRLLIDGYMQAILQMWINTELLRIASDSRIRAWCTRIKSIHVSVLFVKIIVWDKGFVYLKESKRLFPNSWSGTESWNMQNRGMVVWNSIPHAYITSSNVKSLIRSNQSIPFYSVLKNFLTTWIFRKVLHKSLNLYINLHHLAPIKCWLDQIIANNTTDFHECVTCESHLFTWSTR